MYRIEMEFLKRLGVVEQACQQLLEPHPCQYNFAAETIADILGQPHLSLDHQEISLPSPACRPLKLKLHFIRNLRSDSCVIYLHGLASYCMQGRFLLPILSQHFSLCLYDSRGHGLSKAPQVTYGLLQAQDLLEIVGAVAQKGYKNIVLWGRSMGAVTCLRAIQEYGHLPAMAKVKYVIADSPFSSFAQIAQEMVSSALGLPAFLANIVADSLAERIQEQMGLDLRQIDFKNPIETKIPVSFLYSSLDEMVQSHHIHTVAQSYLGAKEVIDMRVGHNDERPKSLLLPLVARIRNYMRKQSGRVEGKRRGLSITRAASQRGLPHQPLTPSSPMGSVKLRLFRNIGGSQITNCRQTLNIEQQGRQSCILNRNKLSTRAKGDVYSE